MTYDKTDGGTRHMDMHAFGNGENGSGRRFEDGGPAHRPQAGSAEGAHAPAMPTRIPGPDHEHQGHAQDGSDHGTHARRRRGRGGRSGSGTVKAVSPDTIESILDAADRVRALGGTDALLLRGFLGLPANTGDAKLISTFISRDGRAKAMKRIDAETGILDSIRPDDPLDMDAVFAIVGLGHDGRLEHWTLLSTFDPEAAKGVAGTDDGKWPRSWNKSDTDESKGLFSLYLKVRAPYRAKLEELRGLLG